MIITPSTPTVECASCKKSLIPLFKFNPMQWDGHVNNLGTKITFDIKTLICKKKKIIINTE